MSLKLEIETWVSALAHYDNNEFDEALKSFDNISDTSKILFNCGVIHATLGEHESAVSCYQRAVKLDQYLAVAYFQQGVSNFLMGDFEEALANFNDTLLYLRGNNHIDYEQLGLKFKLYSCEVLFNRGLCYIYLQQKQAGMQDLVFAAKEKMVADHDVIDEAIREEAEGYTVFSIPVGIVYRPNEAKVKNLKTKDYLGKARLVAASDRANAFTGFAGTERRMTEVTIAKDDRPDDKLSYAAQNLVKPGLTSRSRQQSEPPINRNVFPPTPPPENDRPSAARQPQRSNSVAPRPQPLELGRAAFDQSSQSRQAQPPARPQRSVSERPRPRDHNRDRGQDPRRRGSGNDDYPQDEFDPYATQRERQYSRGGRKASSNMYIEEEDEGDDVSDGEFEMVSSKPRRASPSRQQSRRKKSVQSIVIRIHNEDVMSGTDTRRVEIDVDEEYDNLLKIIRKKFRFDMRVDFKLKMMDDDAKVTMADQDDLDMAVDAAKRTASREGLDRGRVDLWMYVQ